MTERLVRDGRVAVLYSPGYGAGWSTWQILADRVPMMFSPQIADIVDRGLPNWQSQAYAVALVKHPDAFLRGMDDLRVRWLPIGTKFRVMEHDGNEWIEVIDEIDWIIA